MKRRLLTFTAAALLCGAITAQAQTTADEPRGYVEGVIQAAFGNVTSQSFGAEGGFRVAPHVQVFVEGGKVRDTAPTDLGATAQQIAAALTQIQSGAVDWGARQPMVFGDAGIKYLFQAAPNVTPYVMAGFGVAQVSHDVTFSINGQDVTSSLATYGVVLGTDLSGKETKAMLVLGGGVQWNPWKQLLADLQFRYGRVSTEGSATNVSRAGIGIGVRF